MNLKKKLCLILSVMLIITACGTSEPEDNLIQTHRVEFDNNQRVETAEESGAVQPEEGSFTEEKIIIGEGTPWELNGLLTLPKENAENLPAVVLVHGSGPQDMDETIFENKPFKEIAEFLSSNGIAVIRYDKRTLTHGLKMVNELGGGITVTEETIEDAVLAANILKADPRIDENRVFIIGHSLGGMLAPRIHASGGDFAGLILLAGSPRLLTEIMKDQNIAAIEAILEGEARETELANFEIIWDLQMNTLLNLTGDAAKEMLDGGISAYYLIDLNNHPVTDYLSDIASIPLLVIHPEMDLQVCTVADFGLYKEIFAEHEDVTFILYEGLNHLFMQGTAINITELMDEYAIPGNVDGQVMADIMQWILAK
jgi:hypothetical protein